MRNSQVQPTKPIAVPCQKNLIWRIAAHPAERAALIDLRTRVYRGVGKHQRDELMVDKFDDDAFLVGVWLNGQAVASARVIARPADAEWEHDRFITWGDHLPARSDCCEISRFCVERRHRSWRVIRALCHGIADAMLRSGRKHFVACCTDELVPFYTSFFGAKLCGVEFTHDDLGTKKHRLFRCDYLPGLIDVGLRSSLWLVLWPTATAHARKHFPELVPKVSLLRAFWLQLALVLEPVAVFAFDSIRRKRMQR